MKNPFQIATPSVMLDDLRQRLESTRFADQIDDSGWDLGTDTSYLRRLVDHWRNDYDWQATERRLNLLPQFRSDIGGFGIHYLYIRSAVPDATPLLLVHGWPDSFLRFERLIPRLVDPASYGADPTAAFDLIVPSIPGFGFSDRPTARGMNPAAIAQIMLQLMVDELGYETFAAHGGDWGSSICEALAMAAPERLTGLHLTEIPYWHLFATPRDELTKAEIDYLSRGQAWAQQEGAYALIQATKPQTLAAALNDSPVGLAAWIAEKLRAWSDCGGDISTRFDNDTVLDWVMIYWISQTAGSAARLYAESAAMSQGDASSGRVEVPTSVAIFPADIVPAPRAFAERFFEIRSWTEMPRGGHFAAHEEPDLLADDIRRALARTSSGRAYAHT